MDILVKLGRWIFGVAILAFGVLHFMYAHRVPAPGLEDVLPYTAEGPVAAYAIGTLLILAGLSFATGIGGRVAAVVFGAGFVADAFIFRLYPMLADIRSGGLRTLFFEVLSVGATAWLLASTSPSGVGDARGGSWNARPWVQAGRFLFAITMIVFGVEHFIDASFIASLIPAWMRAQLFLAYFTGAGFIAAGLSFAAGKCARLAGILLALMFFIWMTTLHGVRVAYDLHNVDEWASGLVALALCGSGLIAAETIPPKG
jgi:uncharacterized membrane protein